MQFKREKFKYNLSISTTLKNIHAWNSVEEEIPFRVCIHCSQCLNVGSLLQNRAHICPPNSSALQVFSAFLRQQWWSLPQISIAAALKI